MFGYDFLVDENYNTWILEINKSPSMDMTTVFFYFLINIKSRLQMNWSVKFKKIWSRFWSIIIWQIKVRESL